MHGWFRTICTPLLFARTRACRTTRRRTCSTPRPKPTTSLPGALPVFRSLRAVRSAARAKRREGWTSTRWKRACASIGRGIPFAIDLRRKTDATSLIEEAMIFANETVARHLDDARSPSLFRVHEQPSADSLAALIPVFQEFSWFDLVDQGKLVAGDPGCCSRFFRPALPARKGSWSRRCCFVP